MVYRSTAHRGIWPQPCEVTDDRAKGRILLQTPYYQIEHSRDRGGALSAVRYPHGTGQNLLLEPARTLMTSLSGEFMDTAESAPFVSMMPGTDEAVLTIEGMLRDADGEDCGVAYRHIYRYRWGFVRVRKQFVFPGSGVDVRCLQVFGCLLRPDLGHYGVRPGAPAEASPNPAAFGVCQWGRLRPGQAFDYPYESRVVPRYLAVASPGREGLEWFVSSDLAMWDYQATGTPGNGHLSVGSQADPPGVRINIETLDLPRGDARLQGTLTFDFHLGFPILPGRAHRPFLHRSFNRKHWPSEEQVREWSVKGVGTAHFHHDGDSFRDGVFWRDGLYPPFGPADMAEFDRVIATCHRYGIQVATYVSNKELHPTTEAYRMHGSEWARLSSDRGEQMHNYYSGDEFGAQMCLRSGWLEYLKQYIDTILRHHALDGVYFDWNAALYCHNPAHVSPAPSSGSRYPGPGLGDAGGSDRAAAGPLGAVAQSPVGHWDIDELLHLMEWTRQRVGPEGLIIVHDTMTPCAATENFANQVVGMEWGYTRLSTAVPHPDDLPLEWNFMGARPRGVISRCCLTRDADESLFRQMTLRCLLTGTAPWPAEDRDLEMFSPLIGEDLHSYSFADWRTEALRIDNPSVAGAIYHRTDAALVLLGNMSGAPQAFQCTLDVRGLTLRQCERYMVAQAQEDGSPASQEELESDGFIGEVDGNCLTVIRITPVQ